MDQNNDPKRLPYREDFLLELTTDNIIEWEAKTVYMYTLGATEPCGKVMESAMTRWGDFDLKFDGYRTLYFSYNSLELGYIQISAEFAKAIEQNGEKFLDGLRARLGRKLGVAE